jgi:tetrapyrrole methylase family protein / MazG family protein
MVKAQATGAASWWHFKHSLVTLSHMKIPVAKKSMDRLVRVMASLRGKGGCPWDRRQTHKSLQPYLIEEAYEVLEAIRSGKPDKLKAELGDLLLQVVFHSQLAAEKGRFTLADVAAYEANKLIRRHPHVFGAVKIRTAQEQTRHWEKVKRGEKEHRLRKSAVDGVPQAMPALLRARRILSKAGAVRFQWNDKRGAWNKFKEELEEFKEATRLGPKRHQEEELGDLLMALVNVARFERLDPEHALHLACGKIIRRFRQVEAGLASQGRDTKQARLPELVALWNRAKAREKSRRQKRGKRAKSA